MAHDVRVIPDGTKHVGADGRAGETDHAEGDRLMQARILAPAEQVHDHAGAKAERRMDDATPDRPERARHGQPSFVESEPSAAAKTRLPGISLMPTGQRIEVARDLAMRLMLTASDWLPPRI